MKGTIAAIGVGFSIALAAGDVLAQRATPFYLGVSAGASSVKIDDDLLQVTGATASSLSKDESSTGFRLYGAYRFHPNFAVEAGYTDLGTFSATRTVTAPATGTLHADIKASGWNVDLVGMLPLANRFSVFGKVGGFYNEVKSSASTTGAVVLSPGVDPNAKHTDWNLKLGIGAGYDFTDKVGARVEYEFYNDLGSDATGKGDINLLSVGVIVRF